MGETTNNQDRMPQQGNDAQRQQVGQQNQQADRDRREGIEDEGREGRDNDISTGVDTGVREPGRTGDGGAER